MNASLPSYPGVRTRGNSIVIDFTYNGQRCRESLRIKPTKTSLREVSRKRESILYEIAMGKFEYANHFPNSKNALLFSKNKGALITIEQALKEWLKRAEKRCQHSTIRDYNSAIFHHLIPTFGHLFLNQISVTHIYDWIDSLSISNKRINNVLGPLKQAMNDAYHEGFLENNPLERLRILPPNTKEVQPFTIQEINKILSQLEGQPLNLINFAFWSGLRTSELIGLRWEDIDLNNGKAHIRTAIVRGVLKTTKTSSGIRTLELTSKAIAALKQQASFTANRTYVFNDPLTNNPWKGDHIIRKRIWIPALKKAKIPYRKPYSTRHTYASIQLSQGKNPLWVAQQMGHKDWGMIIKTYGRWIKDNQ